MKRTWVFLIVSTLAAFSGLGCHRMEARRSSPEHPSYGPGMPSQAPPPARVPSEGS